MEVRIGVTNVAREIHIEVDDDKAKELADSVEAVCEGESDTLWVQDKQGRRVAIPRKKLAYVDIGSSDERRVGFSGT